ncbi:MAG: helix-turn-helix transcriptional regulator, partial [Oceanospirillaceae bacterium]|nr:helix-turn-helix transcriptional regulator [Oceanospirillaceae bacterium]
ALMKIIFPHLNDILTRPGFLRRPALTRQQLRVLEWADKKKTHVQTAHIMGISERTVRFHFNNIYNKYGVNDKAGAIAKAKMYGQLH